MRDLNPKPGVSRATADSALLVGLPRGRVFAGALGLLLPIAACHPGGPPPARPASSSPAIERSAMGSATTEIPGPRPESPGPMPSVSPVAQIATWTDIVRRASDAWRDASKGHDKGKLAQLYTGDACIKVPGHPDACGRIGVEKAAEAFWSEFPDARTAWSRAWLLGDVLAVESAWMGTNNRADGRNTKKPTYRTAGGSVVTLSWLAPDGQIREQHVYGDEGLVASELGSSGKAFEGLPTTRERHEARGTPAEDANVERVRATFASPPELAAFARDAELADPTRASPLPARSGAGRWVAARASGLTSARVTPTHLWGAEDAVLCEYEATGIRKEGGGAPRGPVTVHGVELFRVEAGQLTLAVRYRDSLELSPPPGPPPSLPSMAP